MCVEMLRIQEHGKSCEKINLIKIMFYGCYMFWLCGSYFNYCFYSFPLCFSLNLHSVYNMEKEQQVCFCVENQEARDNFLINATRVCSSSGSLKNYCRVLRMGISILLVFYTFGFMDQTSLGVFKYNVYVNEILGHIYLYVTLKKNDFKCFICASIMIILMCCLCGVFVAHPDLWFNLIEVGKVFICLILLMMRCCLCNRIFFDLFCTLGIHHVIRELCYTTYTLHKETYIIFLRFYLFI